MSKLLRIGYVVEGTTDYLLLDALIEHFLGTADYIPTQIQPPLSALKDHQGPLGGGWRGVLKWCQQVGESPDGFEGVVGLTAYDCLIIHVDADIATEAELQPQHLSAPCPPAQETCEKIRRHLVTLLGGQSPANVVFCIPAQCTEAWVFAALYPQEVGFYEPLECRAEVERLLIGKAEKLVRDKDGRAKKQTDRYKMALPKIVQNWHHATRLCGEALSFEKASREVLAFQG